MVTTKIPLKEWGLVNSFVFHMHLWPTSKKTLMGKITKRGNT